MAIEVFLADLVDIKDARAAPFTPPVAEIGYARFTSHHDRLQVAVVFDTKVQWEHDFPKAKEIFGWNPECRARYLADTTPGSLVDLRFVGTEIWFGPFDFYAELTDKHALVQWLEKCVGRV